MSMFSTAMFLETMENLQRNLHANAKAHGFWDGADDPDNVSVPTKLCLIHSEISEALEAHRKGDPPCEKEYVGHSGVLVKLQMSGIAEELADAFIRILDLAEHLKIDLARAVLDKAHYNESRPYKHGGKKC